MHLHLGKKWKHGLLAYPPLLSKSPHFELWTFWSPDFLDFFHFLWQFFRWLPLVFWIYYSFQTLITSMFLWCIWYVVFYVIHELTISLDVKYFIHDMYVKVSYYYILIRQLYIIRTPATILHLPDSHKRYFLKYIFS